MSTDFQKLNIILAARDREFTRAMERNTRRVERFANKSNRHLSRVSSKFALLGSAAKRLLPALAAGAVVAQVKRIVGSLDDIGKTADKIGLTTDALQELRAAAESAGVAQGSLDSSLERFSKRIGEAVLGTGAAKKALEEMGLEARELANMGLDTALGVVADRMAAISDPTERAARAAALFGREGVAMVNLLREGSAGMEKMRAEARELGIVIDEDLIRKAEAAQTKLDLMSRVISAQLSSALINLAPLLVSAASGIASVASAVNSFLAVDYYMPELMDADQLREYAAEMSSVQREVTTLTRAQAAYNANVEKFGEGSAKAASWLKTVEAAQADLTAAIKEQKIEEAAYQSSLGTIGEMAAARDAARDRAKFAEMGAEAAERERISREKWAYVDRIQNSAARGGKPVTDEELEGILNLADQFEAAEIAASKILNPVKAVGTATAGAATEAERFAVVIAKIADLSGGASVGTYAEVMDQVRDLFTAGKIDGDLYADMVGDIENKFKDTADAARALENAAGDALLSIIDRSTSAGDAVANLIGQLASMAANAAITGLFKNSGIFDSIAPIFSPEDSFDGGGSTGNGPRSGGLDGKGGFMAMMHPQESVIDHTRGQSAPGGGGGSMNINVNVSGARGNSEITEMVQAGVQQGLSDYDRTMLPRRVAAINNDPRRIS
jgi:hypothetical protein